MMRMMRMMVIMMIGTCCSTIASSATERLTKESIKVMQLEKKKNLMLFLTLLEIVLITSQIDGKGGHKQGEEEVYKHG